MCYLTQPELDDIEENNEGITGVFQLWYETNRCPHIWDTLLMILRLQREHANSKSNINFSN